LTFCACCGAGQFLPGLTFELAGSVNSDMSFYPSFAVLS